MSEKRVIAYADWTPFEHPIPIGVLSFRILRGVEVYSFSYSEAWLNTGVRYYPIGGSLLPFAGRQYPPANAKPFPILFDSAPDRWGRTLLLRRESLIARKEGRRSRTLMESDFLLGVHDSARIGAIRFATSEDGQFFSHSDILATPPMVRLRELEQSASMWEQYKGRSNEEKWLMQLIAPGSSLGGARPKATVADEYGNLWVAKFPSSRDVIDKGAWEMVAHDLARSVGITVPKAQVQRLSKSGTTYLSQRFDRAGGGQRIHFCSALSLLGKHDGEHGSYLELVEFIKSNSSQPQQDLEQLFRRILFSIAISNTDDHLRNHGFMLTRGGWRLSMAYDLNPDPSVHTLSLAIDETDHSLDFSLALDQSPQYGLSRHQAHQILQHVLEGVSTWDQIARSYEIPLSEISLMADSFRLSQ